MHDGDESPQFEVRLTDEAFFTFEAIPSNRQFEHVKNDIGLLKTTPCLGSAYDPIYKAAKPPFPCRVLYCEQFGIYYTVDEANAAVTVFTIEDQRRNPAGRFGSIKYGLVELPDDES